MPPTPLSVKPKPSWIGGELAEHEQQQRPAVGAAGELGGEDADRLDRDRAEAELEDAGVLALVGVEVEVAAALDHAGVEREADPRGRLEGEAEVGRAEVAAVVGEGERGGRAHALDGHRERSELGADRARGLELEPVGREASPRCSIWSLIGPSSTSTGMSMASAGAALEVEPRLLDQPASRSKGTREAAVGEDRGEEAVGAGEVDDDRAVLDRDLDQHVAVGLPGSDVPAQVGADRGAQLLRLEAGAAGDAEQRHRLAARPVTATPMRARPETSAVVAAGRCAARPGAAGRWRRRRSGRRRARPRARAPGGAGSATSSFFARSTRAEARIPGTAGVVGGADVDHADPQHRRATAGPGLHEGDLGDAVGEPGEPVQQLVPPQVGAPAVVAREGGDRVVEQVAQQVEAEPALDVRRRGGGRGDRACAP